MKRVVVGPSGGGFKCCRVFAAATGIWSDRSFMKNWHDDSYFNDCPWLEDSNDALLVAENWNSFKQLI
jgi:tRNA-specific 2-thiouridylase